MNSAEGPPDQEDGSSYDRAADVFRELGDPTRVEIIATLVEAQRAGDGPLSFAELRRRLDVRDSGRFNYHLKQLQPRFVESVEDGYQTRYAGMMAYNLVRAGAAPRESMELEEHSTRPCLLCDESPVARYVSDRVTLTCETYGEQIMGIPVPPEVAKDRTLEGILDFAEVNSWQQLSLALEGFCPYCWGPIGYELEKTEPSSDLEIPEEFEPPVQLHITCERCNHTFNIPLRLAISRHPAVTCFHYDRGIDLSTKDLFGTFSALQVDEEFADSDGGAWIRFEIEGDTLTVEVDEQIQVTAVDSG